MKQQTDRYLWTFTTRKVPMWTIRLTGQIARGWLATDISWEKLEGDTFSVKITWQRQDRWQRFLDKSTGKVRVFCICKTVPLLCKLRLVWVWLWCHREPLTPNPQHTLAPVIHDA